MAATKLTEADLDAQIAYKRAAPRAGRIRHAIGQALFAIAIGLVGALLLCSELSK